MSKRDRPEKDQTIFQINDDNKGKFDSPSNDSRPKKSRPTKSRPAKSRSAKSRPTGPHEATEDSRSSKKRGRNRTDREAPLRPPASSLRSRGNIGSEPGEKEAVGLRVIGGKFRGSKLQYTGDNRVRPMKDRVREAVFNLIGPVVRELHVIDLFGGTGALAIEALSRGAASATIIELHLPTAAMLRKNLDSFALMERCQIRKTDAFFWAKNKQEHPHRRTDKPITAPWLVFCSPPYQFYVDRWDEMRELFDNLYESAPVGSLFVVESDDRFDFAKMPVPPEENKIRAYPPAKIGIVYKNRVIEKDAPPTF